MDQLSDIHTGKEREMVSVHLGETRPCRIFACWHFYATPHHNSFDKQTPQPTVEQYRPVFLSDYWNVCCLDDGLQTGDVLSCFTANLVGQSTCKYSYLFCKITQCWYLEASVHVPQMLCMSPDVQRGHARRRRSKPNSSARIISLWRLWIVVPWQ